MPFPYIPFRTATIMKQKLSSLLLALLCLATALPTDGFAAIPDESLKIPVAISSSPSGASLSIDGKPAGTTPTTIWLLPGSHIARFSLRGAPDTFADFTVEKNASAEVVAKLPSPSAPVLLLSNPSGATVERNGKNLGTTPIRLPEEAPGSHSFTFSANGYRRQTLELNLVGGSPARLEAKLVSSSASVHVTSEPAGANILVNGFDRGTTPADLSDIPEGEASIVISYPGYRKFTSSLRASAGDQLTLHARLEPLPSSLKIVTVPSGARIYIDNVFKGESPLDIPEIAAGSYRVRADLAGYDSQARTLTVGIDHNVTEEFKLVPNVGILRLSTTPAGVTVLIDDKRVGITAAESADKSDIVSTPFVVSNIVMGSHTLTLSRPGYGQLSRTIQIDRDKELSLGTIQLERQFIPDVIVHTRKEVYRGVYIEQTPEFYRLETTPGIIRSIPKNDITYVESIQSKK